MRTFISLFISMFWIVLPLAAQSDVEKYTERFNNGEREITFMREYITLLEKNKKIVLLERVADAYLSQVPIDERYKDSNLALFNKGVKDYRAKSFRDLMENWEKYATKENSTQLNEKVKQLYFSILFDCSLNKKASGDEFKKQMAEDIKHLETPTRELCTTLLDLHTATEKEDIAAILTITKERVSKLSTLTLEGWKEALVLGTAFNYVLEKGDLSQSKELLASLTPLKNKDKKNYIDSLCDNLEGKIIMSE